MAGALAEHLSQAAIGIAVGAHEDEVVLTSQEDGVTICNAVTQEECARWRVDKVGQATLALTVPAVWDGRTQRYYAVACATSPAEPTPTYHLLAWGPSDVQGPLHAVATRVALPRAVHSLWPASAPGGSASEDDCDAPSTSGRGPPGAAGAAPASTPGVVVVHTDGSVGLNTQYVNGKGRAPRAGEGRVVAATASRGRVAVVTVDAQGRYKAGVHALQGVAALKQLATIEIRAPEDASVALLSVALAPARLTLLWGDHSVHVLRVLAPRGGGAALAPPLVRRLAGFDTSYARAVAATAVSGGGVLRVPNRRPVNGMRKRKATGAVASDTVVGPIGGAADGGPTLVQLTDDVVAAVGLGDGGGDAGGVRVRVTVLETRYGTPQEVVEVPVDKHVVWSPVQAVRIGSGASMSLAVAVGGTLLVVNVRPLAATLASVLGSLSLGPAGETARRALYFDGDPGMVPPRYNHAKIPWLEPGAVVVKEADPEADGEANPLAVPLIFTHVEPQPPTTPTPEEELGALVHKGSHAEPADVVARLDDSWRSHGAMPSLEFVGTVAMWCAARNDFDAVNNLLQRIPMTTLSACPGLPRLIASAHRHDVLASVLPRMTDLPAAELAALLAELLSNRSAGAERAQAEWASGLGTAAEAAVAAAEEAAPGRPRSQTVVAARVAVALVEGFAAREICLHPVLAMCHDSAVLVTALRQLSAPQASALASYLLKWLHKFKGSVGGGAARQVGVELMPRFSQVLEWTCGLLDAHFVGLLVTPSGHQTMNSMAQLARSMLVTCRHLGALEGVLQAVRQRGALPLAHTVEATSYAAELLDFRVS